MLVIQSALGICANSVFPDSFTKNAFCRMPPFPVGFQKFQMRRNILHIAYSCHTHSSLQELTLFVSVTNENNKLICQCGNLLKVIFRNGFG